MMRACNGVRHTCNRSPDHRTGDQIEEHSRPAATWHGERNQRQWEHQQQAAQRSSQEPAFGPARDADQKSDQQTRAVESPDGDGAANVEDVELRRDRSVDEHGKPPEDQAQPAAHKRIAHAHAALVQCRCRHGQRSRSAHSVAGVVLFETSVILLVIDVTPHIANLRD